MSLRSYLALAALALAAAPLTPALAADLAGPPPVFNLCAPPPSAIGVTPITQSFHKWTQRIDPPHVVDVERYDPHHPPAVVVPTYVKPQTAFLASPVCDFPDGASKRSWYDGKVFYRSGGVKAAPDSFMVIERN